MRKLCVLFPALALCLGLTLPASAATFTDVSENHWARPFVEEMVEAGVMKGTGNGQFSPDGLVSAAEFATMLSRAFWQEALEANEAQAPAGSPWWLAAVQTVYQQGGFQSTSIDTDFSSAQADGTQTAAPLSRYDMAGMLYDLLRAKDLPLGTERDAEINKSYLSDWEQVPAEYGDAVSHVMATGILTGKSGNRFAGADTMSRAEAAAAMSRLLAYRETQSPVSAQVTVLEDGPVILAQAPLLQDHREEVLSPVNAERAKAGLNALVLNEELCGAALVRAEEIMTLFDHTRPDGRSCFTVLRDRGIIYRIASKNIAAGQ